MNDSKNLRENWSNTILHLSSFINRKKGDLLIRHGFSGLFLVITIIGVELLLLIVSIPSYLAASGNSPETQIKEYKLRRSLTLGTVVTLLIIWVVKLLLILVLSWYSSSHTALQINEIAEGQKTAETFQTTAHDMLVAGIDPKILPPNIIKIESSHKNITITGSARPGDAVLFIFSGTNKLQPKIYTAWADKTGKFTLEEDSGVFNLPKGSYEVSSITYDPITQTKGENAKDFKLEVKGSLFESLFYGVDKILNILAILVILGGLMITMLVT